MIGLGEVELSAKNYAKALISLTDTLEGEKVKSALIEEVNVDGCDQSWVYKTTARVMQNSIYQIEKVGTDGVEESSIKILPFNQTVTMRMNYYKGRLLRLAWR